MIRKFYEADYIGGGGGTPDELDREAQSLIEMFYEKMAFQSTELRRHEIAKQCAIICIDYLIKEVPIYSDAAYKYTTIKAKIESL